MMSSSGESTPDSAEDFEDAEAEEHSFENPNYRKLYAALSITSMMGQNNDHNKHSENQQLLEEQNNGSISDELPMGWERHEDESGPYYWHIPSGTIQRNPPINEKISDTKRDSLIYFDNFDENIVFNATENSGDDNDIQNVSSLTVLVHSLGWMEVDESQLTSATSSKVIQKCIIELSTRGDNNAVRCWGRDTQELVLKVENSCLKLFDRNSDTLLNCQPIQGMRVWGVNDNNDFAFVAKDSNQSDETPVESNPLNQMSPLLPNSSNGLKCHVFHCEEDDNSAQRIATYLRDEIIKLKAHNYPKTTTPHNQRPKHLFIYDSSCSQPSTVATPTAIEFPTPIEEPRKTISAKYLGKTPVIKPMGIDVLNKAIETVLYKDLNEKNDPFIKRYDIPVLVHISPSNIIVQNKETNECMAECRVRYLSFLGIGSHSVRLCGFIVQIDDNQFEAHCFECEPSSGAFCKTIEAACRLRYQKCLDAHRARLAADNASSPTQQNASGIKSTILNVFSKISNIGKN